MAFKQSSVESHRETYLSAQPARPKTPPWVSLPFCHRGRTPGHCAATRQGPQAPVGLNTMQSAVERLTRRPEFLRVAGSGQKWVARGLILQTLHRTGSATGPRVGFTASRRVGNAVARNRARRRLRAAVATVISNHGLRDHDYVLIARKETMRRPYTLLLEDLETALRRLKAWRDA